jgi:HEPN domain-containing protein/predicted nucleotidyltransferase
LGISRLTERNTAMAASETLIEKSSNREKRQPVATDELLADITRRIVERFDPYVVILFGSYAWGKPTADSDIDLLVVMNPNDREKSWRGEVRWSLSQVGDVSKDLVIYTPQELATRIAMKDFFILRILEKGRTLYEKSRPWEKMEGKPTITLLEEWVEKAERDYKGAVAINRRRKDPLPDLVCFHCQQCAEKYLKAFLIHHGQSPEKTHSVDKLLNECTPFDPTLTVLSSDLAFLDKLSVDPRYPGSTASIEEGEDALKAARAERKAIRKALGI